MQRRGQSINSSPPVPANVSSIRFRNKNIICDGSVFSFDSRAHEVMSTTWANQRFGLAAFSIQELEPVLRLNRVYKVRASILVNTERCRPSHLCLMTLLADSSMERTFSSLSASCSLFSTLASSPGMFRHITALPTTHTHTQVGRGVTQRAAHSHRQSCSCHKKSTTSPARARTAGNSTTYAFGCRLRLVVECKRSLFQGRKNQPSSKHSRTNSYSIQDSPTAQQKTKKGNAAFKKNGRAGA